MRTHIIIHTVAKKNETPIEEIKRWHVDENRWSDIGYHYYVTKKGQVQEGRPVHINGAHCAAQGMNKVSIGVCFEGHGDFEEWTSAQKMIGYEFLLELCIKYKIPPAHIKGHREYDSGKTCPGVLIDMAEVRQEVESLLKIANSNNRGVVL